MSWCSLGNINKVLSCFCHVRLFATPWTVDRQALLSTGFPRQENRSGLPCPSPGHLPDPEIEPRFFFFFPLSNFLFFKIYFNWRLITILWWFLPYIDINQPWVDMCSPSWPSLLPPSHPIPQGHPSAPALSTLSHASNLDWWSFSHMVIYMFQCYSLKSSHLHLLPQSPKDCSLHLGLFCCLAYRVIITIFLNSIYMR